jgi:hypothetical protein
MQLVNQQIIHFYFLPASGVVSKRQPKKLVLAQFDAKSAVIKIN